MAGKGKHGRREPNRAATRGRAQQRQHTTQPPIEDEPMLRDVRAAMRAEPLTLPIFVSQILSALDPARFENFGPGAASEPVADLPTLVNTFIDVRYAETTALLHCFAALLDDDLLTARIRRELATRSHPLPEDITGLGTLTARRGLAMTEPEGACENLIIELAGAGVREICMILLVDHRFGSAIKDIFFAYESLESFLDTGVDLARESKLKGVEWLPLDLADLRARLEHGLAAYLRVDELLPEQELWPGTEALVALVARSLPAGGVGYPDAVSDPEVIRAEAARLIEDFQASADELTHEFMESRFYSAAADDQMRHVVAHIVVDAALRVVPDDLVWGEPMVEWMLLQELPVALGGELNEYVCAPAIFRDFIRFCHDDAGAPKPLTHRVLARVEALTGQFLRRREDPDVKAERLERQLDLENDAQAIGAEALLRAALGSVEAIDQLDDLPLPDEALDVAGLPDDIAQRVCRVVALTDPVALDLFDVEIRTATRRLLVAVAHGDPAIFRRASDDRRLAAAALWIIGMANRRIGWDGDVPVKDLLAAFGLKGSISQRAEPLLNAIGAVGMVMAGVVFVGSPALLTAATRGSLLEVRDGDILGRFT